MMWPKQVIARIEGGLGNQLFQYAAARSLADRLGCELALDLRSLALNGDRPYQLDLYRIRADVADAAMLRTLPDWRSTRWGRLRADLSQRMPGLFAYPVFWPSSFAFDGRFERITRPVYLVGYWQTEKYFVWNRACLLQDLELALPMAPSPILNDIKSCSSVALHIRRGDYVSNAAAAQFHGLCDLAYYQKAVSELKQKISDVHVYVFSDEPDWARQHLKLPVPTFFVEANPGHIDLELMRYCKHHVVANSSFSWWGAWLCESNGQSVYAPKRWFADPETNTSDVVPSHWIQR